LPTTEVNSDSEEQIIDTKNDFLNDYLVDNNFDIDGDEQDDPEMADQENEGMAENTIAEPIPGKPSAPNKTENDVNKIASEANDEPIYPTNTDLNAQAGLVNQQMSSHANASLKHQEKKRASTGYTEFFQAIEQEELIQTLKRQEALPKELQKN
jgi:hypothetical protein